MQTTAPMLPRKERTISFEPLLNGPVRSTTFPHAPSTARD